MVKLLLENYLVLPAVLLTITIRNQKCLLLMMFISLLIKAFVSLLQNVSLVVRQIHGVPEFCPIWAFVATWVNYGTQGSPGR